MGNFAVQVGCRRRRGILCRRGQRNGVLFSVGRRWMRRSQLYGGEHGKDGERRNAKCDRTAFPKACSIVSAGCLGPGCRSLQEGLNMAEGASADWVQTHTFASDVSEWLGD